MGFGMESSTQSSHHPSLLLINEIEILFTQIRLMELYVKQAQTTTASEAARARARFQAELTALRDELKQKELALATYQALARQADQNLRTQVEEIRGRLLKSQQLLAARNSELEAATFETGALRDRIAELELIVQKTQATSEIEAIRAREAFQIELATLKTELARKEAALGALQAAHREAEKQLRAQTEGLRAQLAAKTDLLDNRTAELQSVRSETAALLQRIRQLELSGEHAEAAVSEASGLREHLQTELVALRSTFEQTDSSLRENQALTRELEERLNSQLHDLQIQLAEKQELLETRGKEIGELTARTNELQEQISRLELAHKQTVATAQAASSALEDGFQARLKELEAGVSEKTELLQSHTVELQSAHSEIAALRQHIHQLELAAAQAEAANNESNHLREALQHELSTVHRALEQKDASFEQQQAELKESGERLNAQVRDLQHQLSEKHQLLEARQGDLHQALAEIATQGKHISELEHLGRETQAAAAGEIERIRGEAQSELRASQTLLAEKERAFQEQQAAGAAFAAALDGQIQDLRNQVRQKQELLEQRDRQLETASSETGMLRDRIAQVESIAHEAEPAAAAEVARMRAEFHVQSAALQAQLDEKARALAENQAFVQEIESRLQAQIRELQGQLAERQLLIETRTSEISGLESKLATLSEQLVYFESSGQKAVLATAQEAELARRALEAELSARQETLRNVEQALADRHAQFNELQQTSDAQLHELRNQLTEKRAQLNDRTKEISDLTARTHDLQEEIARLELAKSQTVETAQATASELEHGFRARVAELEAKVSEKGQLLENRTAELQNSQSETAALQQRICELELTGEKARAAATEAGQIRESLQAELIALRTEIERRDSSLHKNQAAARAAEDHLLGQLRDLQAEVAEKQGLLEARRQEMSEFAASTHDLQEEIARLELANRQTVETAQTTASELEHGFRARVAELEASVSEKTEFLQSRTAELESAKSEHAALMQRIHELEVTGEQAEAAKNEANRLREILQNDLSNVHRALEQRAASLQQQQAEFRESSGNLNAQVHDLRCRLAEKDSLLETRAREVGELTAATSELREQIVRLELAHRQTVATVQSTAGELERGFRARVAELEAAVSEKEDLLRNRTAELESIRSETATLTQRTHQLELAGGQANAAASEAARIRQTLQDELVLLRTAFEQKDAALQENEAVARELKERLQIQVHDLQTEVAEKQGQLEARRQEISDFTARTNDLQEQIARLELANKQTVETAQSTASELEHGFRARVAELEASVSKKTEFLQSRTAELQNAQSEIAALQQRLHQLELTGEKNQAAATEAAQIRESLQAELIALRTEIERKSSSLQENQAAAHAAEDRLHEQLRDLQSQLAEQRHVGESREHTLRNATSEITALREQVLQLESARAAAEKAASLDIQRVSEQYQTELAHLRAYVEQTTLTMEERRRTTQALEQKLNDETRRLEAQLVEKQISLDQGIAELQGNRSELSALHEQVSQLELARKHSEMLAAAQAEQIRERVKTEVGTLDAQLAEKENALKILENRSRDLEAVFNTRLDELHVQLTEKQLLIESHDIEMTDLRTQIAALLEQISRLEHDNKQALEQQWAAASGLEQGLFDRIEGLQTQLAEKSTTVDAREGEIRDLESEIKGLAERLAQSEVAIKEAQAKAAGDMELIRVQSQAELAALQTELERQVQRLQKREAIVYSTEQSLQVEINSLRAEIKEKHGLLQSRNDELLRVKAEMDALQERIVYLESAARQAELERVHEPKGIAENARTELDSKERILEERQAAVNGMEEGFRTQIDNLRNELAEKQALLDNPGTNFLLGKPTLTESQRQKLIRLEELVENIKADNEQTLGLPNNRRWRFSLSRKRRWK
jgi:chromosome segregation ATPase